MGSPVSVCTFSCNCHPLQLHLMSPRAYYAMPTTSSPNLVPGPAVKAVTLVNTTCSEILTCFPCFLWFETGYAVDLPPLKTLGSRLWHGIGCTPRMSLSVTYGTQSWLSGPTAHVGSLAWQRGYNSMLSCTVDTQWDGLVPGAICPCLDLLAICRTHGRSLRVLSSSVGSAQD